VVEVQRAVESDCMYYVDVHCSEARGMGGGERLRYCDY